MLHELIAELAVIEQMVVKLVCSRNAKERLPGWEEGRPTRKEVSLLVNRMADLHRLVFESKWGINLYDHTDIALEKAVSKLKDGIARQVAKHGDGERNVEDVLETSECASVDGVMIDMTFVK